MLVLVLVTPVNLSVTALAGIQSVHLLHLAPHAYPSTPAFYIPRRRSTPHHWPCQIDKQSSINVYALPGSIPCRYQANWGHPSGSLARFTQLRNNRPCGKDTLFKQCAMASKQVLSCRRLPVSLLLHFCTSTHLLVLSPLSDSHILSSIEPCSAVWALWRSSPLLAASFLVRS